MRLHILASGLVSQSNHQAPRLCLRLCGQVWVMTSTPLRASEIKGAASSRSKLNTQWRELVGTNAITAKALIDAAPPRTCVEMWGHSFCASLMDAGTQARMVAFKRRLRCWASMTKPAPTKFNDVLRACLCST